MAARCAALARSIRASPAYAAARAHTHTHTHTHSIAAAAFSTHGGSHHHHHAGHYPGEPGYLTHATVNSHLKAAAYAVRGEIVLRAQTHAHALSQGQPRPFNKVVFCNIGNPHELGQKPITFFRQVFALVNHPAMLDDPRTAAMFPPDAIERARKYVRAIPGGTGAYTTSQGLESVRAEVVDFLMRRDGGVPAHARDLFLTDGASPAVQMLVRTMVRSHVDAIMIPIPQYPLYSASIALYGGSAAPYLLNEEKGWSLPPEELERSIKAARASGKHVRAIAVINPGNPTGNCLTKDNIRSVIEFAVKERIAILADEVYQENVWTDKTRFHSFKSVAAEMGVIDTEHTNNFKGLQLASFHSVSKGFVGECGRRGGYVELVGFEDGVRSELYKLASISLCSNVGGQIMMGLMVNPPAPGEASYADYVRERDDILSSLKRRATKLVDAFRKMEGITCEAPEGALYIFPRIRLPPAAVAAAKEAHKAPDAFYCINLLDATGIVVVPGSGFGQADGTYHLRSTILPSEAEIDEVIRRFSEFHAKFMDQYRS